jgi:hypothetical protein
VLGHKLFYIINLMFLCWNQKKARKQSVNNIGATSAFRDDPHRMLKVIQRFGKQCSCHLQGESVLFWSFWKPFIEQALGGWLYVTNMIGGTEERCAVKSENRTQAE